MRFRWFVFLFFF